MSHLPIPSPIVSTSPSMAAFISGLSESLHRLLSKHRAWSELVDPNSLSRPNSLSEAASRLLRNIAYFRINYAELLAAVFALSLLSHPTSLLCLVVLAFGWTTLVLFRPPERPLIILGHQFSRNEVLAVLTLWTALVMLFTSVCSVLLHAALVGVAVISVHGAIRCPEDLFADDQAPQYASGGFINGFKQRSSGQGAGPTTASFV